MGAQSQYNLLLSYKIENLFTIGVYKQYYDIFTHIHDIYVYLITKISKAEFSFHMIAITATFKIE